MPQIAVINESTATGDAEVDAIVRVFNKQWNVDLRPVWGLDDAVFERAPRGTAPPKGAWWVVFLDDSHHAHKLGYHDLTNEGLPIAKVFVQTVLADRSSLSVAATHEVCEMAVDPWLNNAFQDSKGAFWAGEICDPVEDDTYGYRINGTLVTNFVTPDWFAPLHAGGTVDFNRRAKRAFEVLPGGYCQKFDARRGWLQVSGEAVRHSRRDAVTPGTRRERRARRDGPAGWARSTAKIASKVRVARKSRSR